ncbi:receptor-like protein kinase [Camellia sinensis]|uniref:receptor-like protein kinase n=1 Tax=Camellia sinensis TaxID=4442 RepID=UPI001036BCF6|nr:receptor-like protein kinase [Camellia sinensis]
MASQSTEWTKPISILSKLKIIQLSNCEIVGKLPINEFLNLTQLSSLEMDYNFLTSSIPTRLANITSLSILDLSSSNLQGFLPYLPQLRELHISNNPGITIDLSSMFRAPWGNLEILDIGLNHVNESIPTFIANMSSLLYFSAESCSIHGPIPPSLYNLSKLEYLILNFNYITGNLSSSISNLQTLQYLSLFQNSLQGHIPDSICQISSLQYLHLASNKMTGELPDCIRRLTNLSVLLLSENNLTDNNLSGTIPSWLLNLPRLGYLDLSSNNLQGVIPPNIRLQLCFGPTTLNLAGNRLEGPIPLLPETIEAVDLSRNNFTGGIPTQVGGLQNVKYLSFSSNQLSGPIPLSFCHTNNVLMLVDLSNNSLSGTIPASLGNCTSLISLRLARNNLRGNIPNELKAATNLIFLQLNGNHFSGPFPTFIRELQNLEVLNLGNNKFEGNIPRFIGDLQKLRILVLELNSFNGSIPKEINNLWDLQFIGFSNNKLSGAIPDKLQCFKMLTSRPRRNIIGRIISFMYSGVDLNIVIKGLPYELDVIFTDNSGIDLSCNLLTGLIPPAIGLLEGLFMLNLSHNSLYGEIPMSIGKMSELESLDLSFNNLSGSIPMALASLDFLSYLNLSYNNLSGEIPKGMHFDTLFGDGSPYIGNRFLCGAPDGPNCSRNGSSSSETVDADDDARQKWLFYAVVTIGFGVGLWGYLAIMYLMKEKWKKVYWEFIDRVVLRITRCITKN